MEKQIQKDLEDNLLIYQTRKMALNSFWDQYIELKKNCNAKEEEDAKAERREPELLPHFSCHHLRHTFCTRFCENETNLKIIQEIMGHADITTTMDIYNEATKDKKMESFAGLEGKIKIR